MRLIADSHVMLWYLGDLTKLSPTAHKALNEAEDTDGIGVSVASLMDLWYAVQKAGPSRIDSREFEGLKAALADPLANAHLIPIGESGVLKAESIPKLALRDPFDRLIVATAIEQDLPLVTADAAILSLENLNTIW